MVVASKSSSPNEKKKAEKKLSILDRIWLFIKALLFILLSVIIFILLIYALAESLCSSKRLGKLDIIKKICRAWNQVKNGKTIPQMIAAKILSMLYRTRKVGGERLLTYLYYIVLIAIIVACYYVLFSDAIDGDLTLVEKVGLGIAITMFAILFFINVFQFIVNAIPKESSGVAEIINQITVGIFKIPIVVSILIVIWTTLLYTKMMYFEPNFLWKTFMALYCIILVISVILLNYDRWYKFFNIVIPATKDASNKPPRMSGGRPAGSAKTKRSRRR